MRSIIFLLLVSLMTMPVLSQQPSQKEMQEQMAQMKKEMKQQVADLEKQIADAKIREGNPETIKEMENRLATMKQMLGAIDQVGSLNNTKPKTLPETKTILPKYVSPIVPIPLKQPVVVPTNAQAKDLLLWYRGKKIDANTLVTTKGMVVRYDKPNNRVIIKPDEKKDTTFLNIVKNLAKCRQWTDQYINKVATETNSFFDYPQVMITIKEFDLIEKAYNNIVKNTIALPENTMSTATGSFNQTNNISRGPSPNFDMIYIDSAAYLRQLHQDLLNYMKEPRPPLDAWPTPPGKEFELCSYCDPSIQEKHENLKNAWQQKFLEYEQELLKKMKAVAAWRNGMGAGAADAGVPGLEADINKATQIAFERWDKKVTDLEYLYGRDIHFMDIVLENMLLIERQKKIYYGEDDESYKTKIENRMKIYLDLFITYFKGQKAVKNYDLVFNTGLLWGLERHHKILGNLTDAMDATVRVQDLIDEIKAFNRFALTVSLDFRLEQLDNENKKVLEAYGEISTEVTQKVYVSLGRLGDCGWQLYLTGTDYNGLDEKTFYIPLKVKNGSKKIIEPHRSHTSFYNGPLEMLMVLPSFRISFCNAGNKDSIIFGVLRFKPEEDLSIYTIDFDHYSTDLLQHVNKMFISATKTKDMAANVTAIAIAMTNVSSQATVDKPTGYPKLDKMQVDYKMKGIQHDFQKTLAETTHFQNPVIYFDAQNGKALLLDVSIDIPNSEIDGKYNLTKGIRTIKVEHDPQ